MLQIAVKTYQELTLDELYNLLQLRSEVFVVEQDCVYQDVDGKDSKALHILGYEGDSLVAYTRVFKPGDYFELASIGRVVVCKNARGKAYGYRIMEASISAIAQRFGVKDVKISAQTYLKRFYNTLGFKETGAEYLEDGIPHIAMVNHR